LAACRKTKGIHEGGTIVLLNNEVLLNCV